MNVFDRYLSGDMEGIEWNFNKLHLDERLKLNGISKDFIKNKILNDDPNDSYESRDNSYVVFFDAPESKDCDEIRVIFYCNRNEISVVSIMPNTDIGTLKNQDKHRSSDDLNLRHHVAKAHSKRKKMR